MKLKTDERKIWTYLLFIYVFSSIAISNGFTFPESISFAYNGQQSMIGGMLKNAYAQTDPTQTPGYTTYGRTWTDTVLGNGQHQYLSHEPRLPDGAGHYNSPYFYWDNGGSVTIATGLGSYVYDKSSCGAKFYTPSTVPNSTGNIVNSIGFTLQYTDSLNGTWYRSGLNDVSCQTQISENSTALTITGTRANADGTWFNRYTVLHDQPMEYLSEFTNNSTSHYYVISETQDGIPSNVNMTVNDIDNKIVKLTDGTSLFKSSLSEMNGLNYNISGQSAFYSLDKSKNDLYKISYHLNSDGTQQITNDFVSPSPLNIGQSFSIDPTYSYNTGSQWYETLTESGGVCSSTVDFTDGGYGTATPTGSSIIYHAQSAYCQVRFIKITHSVPAGATISSISLQYNVAGLNGSPDACAFVNIPHDPSTASAATMAADVISTSSVYVSGDTQCDSVGNGKTVTFSSQANTDWGSTLGNGWFAVGMRSSSLSLTAAPTYPLVNTLQIQFVYDMPPSQVTGLTATAVAGSQINLSWNAVTTTSPAGGSAVTAYTIQRSTDGSSYSTLVANTGSTATTYSNTGLTNGQIYYYKVAAINGYGTGSYSTASSTTAGDIPSSMSAPTVTANTGYTESLSWSAPSANGYSITGYKIEYSTNGGSTWNVQVANTGTTTTSYTTGALTSGTAYNWRIEAINALGTSSNGAASSGIVAGDIPSQVTGLTSTAASTTSINLSWTPPSGNGYSITGYKIERSTDGSNWTTIVSNTGTTTTSYTDTGLSVNTQYWYRISAINSLGTGSASSSSNTYTLPNAPTALIITGETTTTVSLSWTAPSGTINGYKIERESPTNGGFSTIVANTGTTATSYTDTGLTLSTQYNYRISAIGNGGTSAVSTSHSQYTALNSPTSLTTNTVSLSQINLSWTAPSGTVTGYRIDRESPVNGGFSTIVANTGTTAVTYSNTGLTTGTQYNYKIFTLGINGTTSVASGTSANYTITNAPSGLSVSTISSSELDLSWTAPSGTVTGYKIERSPDNSAWSTIVSNTGTTGTTYANTGLNGGTTYWYKISAINSGGTSTASGSASGKTIIGPPTNLVVTPHTNSNTQLDLVWAAPSTGTPIGYKIERSIDGSTWNVLVPNTSNTQVVYTDSGLTQNTQYWYRVSTIDSTNTSGPSNSASAWVNGIPGKVSGLTLTSLSTSSLHLAWNTPSSNGSSISGYKVERSLDNSAWSTIAANTGNSTTKYNDTGLSPAIQYWYRISGINGFGTGTASNSASAYTIPTQPTSLVAVALDRTNIKLSWTAPSGTVTGYRIDRESPVNGGFSTIVANTGTTAVTYTNSGLTANTQYNYKVYAINSGGTSAASNSANVFTLDVPGQTTGLTAISYNDTEINLSWTAPTSAGHSAILGYKIEHATNGTNWTTLVNNTNSIFTVYSHNSLVQNSTHYYRVSAWNNIGIGQASNTASASTYIMTHAKQFSNYTIIHDIVGISPKINVTKGYPNPVLSQVSIYINGSLYNRTSPNISITAGTTNHNTFNYIMPINYVRLSTAYTNLTTTAIITNGSWTVTMIQKNNVTEQYTTQYNVTPKLLFVYNYTVIRVSSGSQLSLNITRDTTSANNECFYQPGNNFNRGGFWVNGTPGTGYYRALVKADPNDVMYYTCYNDGVMFQGASYGSNIGTIKSVLLNIQSSVGNFFGVPLGVAIVLTIGSIWTGRTASTGIIFTIATIEILIAIGLFSLGTATLGLIMAMGAVGLFMGTIFRSA